MISQFEVAGHKYQAGGLDVFNQLLIAKRLMPVLKTVFTPETLVALASMEAGDKKPEGMRMDAVQIIPAICDAVYALSDEDITKLTQMCLRVVQRQQASAQGGAWANVAGPDGGLMFKDIKLPHLVQITARVIGAHLSDFFSTAP